MLTKRNRPHACIISALSVSNTLAVLILAFFMARQSQQTQVKQDTLGTLPSTAGVDTPHARPVKDISPQQTANNNFFAPQRGVNSSYRPFAIDV